MTDEPFDLWDDPQPEADGGEDLGRFETDDAGSYVDAHMGPDADPQEQDYRDLWDAMGLDFDQAFQLHQTQIDGLDNFDPIDTDARGPYDASEVIEFMNDTGWWDIADIYYDDETDEYYVDINYDDGAASG